MSTINPVSGTEGAAAPESVPQSSPELTASSAPRGGRVTRRDGILDGAARMFAEYGYHGASLRSISSHIGISHPGMLHHFESKRVLLESVIERLEAEVQEALARIDALSVDVPAFRRGLVEVWDPRCHSMQLLAMLYTDAVSEEHPGRFRMARLRLVHEHVLEECFTLFAERGLLREGIDPAFASRALMDLILGHAVREKTVRAMRRERYGDSPLTDLDKLLGAFLARGPQDDGS